MLDEVLRIISVGFKDLRLEDKDLRLKDKNKDLRLKDKNKDLRSKDL